MTECLYKAIETAKNGTPIPVFQSGKTMESRYNPERDAETLCSNIETDSSFFLVLGLGSGLFIKKLLEKYKNCFILVLEINECDISFLEQLDNVKELLKLTNVRFLNLKTLSESIIQNYLPSKYGDIKIIEQRAWILENQNKITEIQKEINRAIGIVSADYSVQAHFGKLWLKNILENARLAEKTDNSLPVLTDKEIQKTALIVAAGPSLESFLKNNFEELSKSFYIIATDTAFSILEKKGITANAVISIDGQNISYNHFLHNTINSSSLIHTLFYFDLCANSCITKKIYSMGHKISFFCSGHPLSSAINNFGNNFLPFLFSGAGTVTITALDFAVQLGFKNIQITGADFGYINGKAYAYGTYLDNLYNKNSFRISTSETLFNRLMFRTPLIKNKNKSTTEILEAYKFSLEKYINEKDIQYENLDNIYILHNKHQGMSISKSDCNFSFNNFIKQFSKSTPQQVEIILLPYIAWLKNHSKYKNKSYAELLNLAFKSIVSYNI